MKKLITLVLICAYCNSIAEHTSTYKFDIERYVEFKPEYLYSYISKTDLKHKDIVICQAILETGYYTSNALKTKNNLFGLSNLKGLIKFKHWTQSVDCYLNLQKKTYKGGDYYTYLDKLSYAEDPEYINKLKIINKRKKSC